MPKQKKQVDAPPYPVIPKTARYIVGIDAGTNTGYAVWDRVEKKLTTVTCYKIHKAIMEVANMWANLSPLPFGDEPTGPIMFVMVEDARQATYNRQFDAAKAQGAGSVKRDASIWEGFLRDYGIPFKMCRPNAKTTKFDAETFAKYTGWHERTNEHARDAAMIVYGR